MNQSNDTRISVLCSHCRLFLKDKEGTTCGVYLDGIPLEFIRGERVCRKIVPVEESKGIVKKIWGINK